MKNTDINKPIQIEVGEWYYKGCFIQEQDHPSLLKYHVFKDTELQETIDVCSSFKQAKKLCQENEVIKPKIGLVGFGYEGLEIIHWLKNNKEYLSIRAIEKAICCPTDTLQKAIQGKQGLPKKWIKPLRQFLNNLKNCKSGGKK